jgi:hypothetical protein
MFRKLHEDCPDQVTVEIDGVSVTAQCGEPVAGVLLRQPEPWTRRSQISGSKRAPYCMMGVCFDCLAVVDGEASVQTCLRAVRGGMVIARQVHKRSIDD